MTTMRLPMMLPFENKEAVLRLMAQPGYNESEAMQAHVAARLAMSTWIDMSPPAPPDEQDVAPLVNLDDSDEEASNG